MRAGEVVGQDRKRVVKKLHDIAETVSILISQEEGDVGVVVEAIGGKMHARNMNGDGIRACFGRCRWVRGAKVQERIAREGVPEEIVVEGFELAYGVHKSAEKYRQDVMTKATQVGVVEEGEAASHLRHNLRGLAEGSGVAARRGHDRDRHVDSGITDKRWEAKANPTPKGRRPERVRVGGCCPGPGCGLHVSPSGRHIRRPPLTVQVARKPQVVRGGREGNPGSSSSDDVNVGEYVGGSLKGE